MGKGRGKKDNIAAFCGINSPRPPNLCTPGEKMKLEGGFGMVEMHNEYWITLYNDKQIEIPSTITAY